MKILKRIIILKWIFLQYESISEYLNNSLIFNLCNPCNLKIRYICKIMYDYDPFLHVSRLNLINRNIYPFENIPAVKKLNAECIDLC